MKRGLMQKPKRVFKVFGLVNGKYVEYINRGYITCLAERYFDVFIGTGFHDGELNERNCTNFTLSLGSEVSFSTGGSEFENLGLTKRDRLRLAKQNGVSPFSISRYGGGFHAFKWKPIFYCEARNAAIAFLVLCKKGDLCIHKDIAPIIAKKVYFSHESEVWNRLCLL